MFFLSNFQRQSENGFGWLGKKIGTFSNYCNDWLLTKCVWLKNKNQECPLYYLSIQLFVIRVHYLGSERLLFIVQDLFTGKLFFMKILQVGNASSFENGKEFVEECSVMSKFFFSCYPQFNEWYLVPDQINK